MDRQASRKVFFAVFVLIGALSVSNISYAKKDAKLYFLYGDAMPGTKFKEKIATSSVPFNKRYKDMSPELQARIKANYGGLADTETPPFPKKGNRAIYEPLIKAHRGLGRDGDVVAVAMIKTDGSVGKITVYKAPNKSVATMINYILSNTEFDPGTCDGSPCQMEYLFDIRLEFSPPDTR